MNEHVLRVTRDHGPFGELLRASRPIAAGEPILFLTGEIVSRPDMHTLQLGPVAHLSTTGLWKAMNHACAPNVRIDFPTRTMVAIRDIAPGEELVFNYNTTEWSMAAPFPCGCGRPGCVGTVRGYRYLDRAQRAAIAPWLSPFIAERAEEA